MHWPIVSLWRCWRPTGLAPCHFTSTWLSHGNFIVLPVRLNPMADIYLFDSLELFRAIHWCFPYKLFMFTSWKRQTVVGIFLPPVIKSSFCPKYITSFITTTCEKSKWLFNIIVKIKSITTYDKTSFCSRDERPKKIKQVETEVNRSD